MNTRLLGVLMILGSTAAAVNSFRNAPALDSIGSIAILLWYIGGVFGLIGMLRLNALGQNPVARAAAFLPMLGFATLIVADTMRMAGFFPMGTPVNNVLAAIGWVGILAGMLVVGILTIAAKTWSGWRRFVPLLTIVAIPVGLGLGALVGSTQVGGAAVFFVFILLGVVVAATQPIHELQPGMNA